MKNYAELIKARLEQVTGVIAQLAKGLIYFKSDTNRPVIDDGTDVSQLMMEKHLPEARRTTKVELDDAGTGNEIEGILPVLKGGTGQASYPPGAIIFKDASGAFLDGDLALIWDDAAKKLQIGTGPTSSQALTVDGGLFVQSGTIFGTLIDGTRINISSTTTASVPYPSMTEAQRDAIGLVPPEGSGIFNTDTKRLNTYDSAESKWVEVGTGAGGGAGTPIPVGVENILSLDATASADIADLTFTGLTIGAKYSLKGQISLDSAQGFINGVQFQGGSSLTGTNHGRVELVNETVGELTIVTSGVSLEFTADSTTLYTNKVFPDQTVFGDGTKGRTFLQLREIPQLTGGGGGGGLSYWQKTLSADLASDGVIGDLAVTGLVIGEKYKVTLNVRAIRQSTALDEIQEITFSTVPTYGLFQIEFAGQTTLDIPYDASAAVIQGYLEDLSNIGVGECVVAGDFSTGFTLSFGGALGATNVAEVTIPTNSLVSGETGGVNEVQDLIFSAVPTGGSFTITFDGETTAAIAYNATVGQVEAALNLLPNINGVTVTAI